MDEARASGDDVIAIPHNANGSNGLMFSPARFDGSALDADQAALRVRNEPVAEVIQIKGQSETTPRLSPDDEWADFEVVPWRTTNAGRCRAGSPGAICARRSGSASPCASSSVSIPSPSA